MTTFIIVFVVFLVTVPLLAFLGRRSGQKAIDRLGVLAPEAIHVVAFMTGAAVKPLRLFDPAIPHFSELADRMFTGRVLIAIADHSNVTFWRSGKEPQLLVRLPIARLQNAVMVGEGLTKAMHLALTFGDAAGQPVTIPLVAHGASGVKGRPSAVDLQTVAARILALRASR